MFFDLVRKNSKRSRKENGLFFASLVVVTVAFYILLSLPRQDVMVFLQAMESDAVNKLIQMIPIFYGMTLVILFFLVYFASKYQMKRRSHEFGVYLVLGMRKGRLFLMLLAEDLWSSVCSLLVGIPVAVLLSEIVSLVTARLVGIGILGHQTAFALDAVLETIAGFLLIKFAAFVILSGKISREEVGSLLSDSQERMARPQKAGVSALLLIAGILGLGSAYVMAIQGISWSDPKDMGVTLVLGLVGTFCIFWGFRVVLGALARCRIGRRGLAVFDFRQLQEQVICQPSSLAVSSLLILAGLCCFGFGVAASWRYSSMESNSLDYTFLAWEGENIKSKLQDEGLEREFQEIFEMKTGYIRIEEETPVCLDSLNEMVEKEKDTEEKERLQNILRYAEDPHIIALSGYNELRQAAGEEELILKRGQAAVYMDNEFISLGGKEIMNRILEEEPKIQIAGEEWNLTGEVQNRNLVVDRAITLSFALLVPDEDFAHLTQGNFESYWNAVIAPGFLQDKSMVQAITEINRKLDAAGMEYESYLQNIGRQLFYVVASSYLTIYLAVIFLIIANTVLGVQFLMQQQKTGKRYRTLIRLGSSYQELCRSARRQVRWYFGIPVLVAAVSSMFGVRALFQGMLPASVQSEMLSMMAVAAAMIFFVGVMEWCYMAAVMRLESRHILHWIEPKREE